MPTQDELRELFDYDSLTGELVIRRARGQARTGQHVTGKTAAGYVKCKVRGRWYRVHRLIWVWHYGPIPRDKVVDHINWVRHDNRILNLRLLESATNSRRRRDWQKLGRLHCLQRTPNNKWHIRLVTDGKRRSFGVFARLRDAINRRDEIMRAQAVQLLAD